MIIYRDTEKLQLWFEIDRQQKGISGLLSNLLGSGDLTRTLSLSSELSPEDAGQQVIDFLNQTT